MNQNTTETNPLVSIIVSFYNPPLNYFKDAIESILAQTYNRWEAIIVNDGSSKNYKRFLDDYVSNLNDKRISILNLDKNYGLPETKNKGIKASQGKIITFLDSDDILLPWFFEEAVKHFSSSPDCLALITPAICYLSFFKLKKFVINNFTNEVINGHIHPDYIFREKEIKEFFSPRFYITKEVFNLVKFEKCQFDDLKFLYEIINKKELEDKIKLPPVAGYLYRQYPSTKRITSDYDLKHITSFELVGKYGKPDLTSSKLLASAHTNGYRKIILNYIKHKSKIKLACEIIRSSKTLKEKLRDVKSLIKNYFFPKLLMRFGGIDMFFLHLLMNKKNNYYKLFQEKYLSCITKDNTNPHAKKLFKKIF